MIKISVITVCYNAEKTITETISSVVNQDYDNLEYVIIDGGSNDNTKNIISKYIDRISYFISEPDKGIYDAMNKGLRAATGDFVIFLGADDHLISHTVISNVAHRINDTKEIYYGDVFRPIRNDIYCHRFNRFKLAVKNISHQAIFYPKAVYKTYAYDVKYKVFADYAYNLNLYSKFKFNYLGLTVSYFCDSGTSAMVSDFAFDQDETMLKIQALGRLPFYYSVLYHWLRNLVKGEYKGKLTE